jgi:pSer/pThr/pTyr-binding forkhead associated (FHA) protein
VIGRAPECDLFVPQDAVSSRHCRLTATAQGFFLEDLGSSNGTYVNGKKVTTRIEVHAADTITLGKAVPMPWPTLAETIPPRKQVLQIGRDPGNDVVLDYPMVSARHARVSYKNGQATIEDLGSTNGTALGRPDRKITQAPLRPEDVVFFGSLRVPACRLLGDHFQLGEEPHEMVSFHGQSAVFGRDARCDIVLKYPMISARHARLSRKGGQLWLEDLGSTNGTYLNGDRLGNPAIVQPGDVIGLGSYTFKLDDQGNLE